MQYDQKNIFTVSEVSQSIKNVLQEAFPFLNIKGEISNFKLHTSGHMYFQLKDAQCQISCVMFKGQRKKSPSFKDGDQVILTGKVSVFEARGSYQIIVYSIDLVGLGDLLIAYEKLKADLRELGYFEKTRKLKIPRFAKKVGVITSASGAVIQDMLHVLKRPEQNFHIILNPVNVQGRESAKEIAQAIDYFNKVQTVDLIIICRGGGSIEDLWAFNERIIADSIFKSKIPLISAVGHETDCTISDYVADYRAATPTAAAQVIIKSQELLKERIDKLRPLMKSRIRKELEHCKKTLERYLNNGTLLGPEHILAKYYQGLDYITQTIETFFQKQRSLQKIKLEAIKTSMRALHPKVRLYEYKQKFLAIQKHFNRIPRELIIKRSKLTFLYEHLQSVNPSNILQKGFCIPFEENSNSIIMGADKTHENQNITLKFHNGTVKTQVKEVLHDRKKTTKKL